jgi:hypothetical protein
MTWTFYLQKFDDGMWSLFRSRDLSDDEIYRIGDGWIPTRLLFDERQKGWIDADDIISAAEAGALIAAAEEAHAAAKSG